MNVAVLGLGFMGARHVKAWGSVRGAKLAGVMSSNPAKRSGDLTSVGGNLGSVGERFDFEAVRRFDSIKDAFRDSDIDAVDICLPTDLHAPVTIEAVRAGKHVLVEKPMALEFADAEEMRREAYRAGRLLMVAQVVRFISSYRDLADWIKGRQVISAVFRRQCAEPSWSGWLTNTSRSGGAALDLLIHDLDFCISLWGMPESISATGEGEMFDSRLIYPGHGPVRVAGGWVPEVGFPFSMEYSVTTEAGTREWAFPRQRAGDEDPFVAELQYFTDCVAEGKEPELCPAEQSAMAVTLARLMLESRGNDGRVVRVV